MSTCQEMLMAATLPTKEMTVAEVLETWPETVEVFQALKTACVGCVMAPFDTLADVARIYELELDMVLEALHQAILTDPAGRPSAPGASAADMEQQ
jgi:hybrid cluster-associated redox disulfide protein